ncbi:hypothetical protein B0J12DRAFT_573396 [Macrophomina phaseolina]|uniref:Amine oxidase domain-containing protein n=1 Tax=Macrophomina phaseolina TaxID=35725 RepID=A0ABQ8GAV8_9PEZI|nr:hypothetical protein B0J12DRAFT_573396 [Macrophomina phaseolina]
MSLPLIRRAALPKGGGSRKPHVCVVGAGVSGLRCADVLLQAGLRVTVLEARRRVGGRLCQATTNSGHTVDLGPNWIHGTDDNPILDLAKETGTITHNWDGRQCIYDQYGAQLSETEATDASETIWSIIGDGMEFSKQHSASIPASKSLLDYVKEKTSTLYTDEDEQSKHLDEKTKEEKRNMLLKIAEMWGAFVGSPLERQSLRFFWLEECIDGENLFVAETYRKILDRIARPALEGADIKFGQRVKTIETIIDNEGNEDGAVKVHLADGSSAVFDEVVMTAPLGWLKRNKDTAFKPALPDRVSRAIDNLGYGCLDKFYISFPTAFWNMASSQPTTKPKTAARDSVPNTTATTAPLHQAHSRHQQNTSTQKDDGAAKEEQQQQHHHHHPGFTQWTAPLYARDTNPRAWNQECVNMAALPGGTAHPTLLFYTFGPTSQHLAAILAEDAQKTDDSGNASSSNHSPSPEATARILRFFEPYYARLPNYDERDPVCQPSSVLATAWTNDELAGYGSYTNFQVGLEEGDVDIEVLRRGMPERRVWFAGEHTASFLALGTVTGAYWSGEGVGRALAWAYGAGVGGKGEGKEVE